MRPSRFILVDNRVVPEPDLMKWAKWMEDTDRAVKRTEVAGFLVSTVFLGLDHRFVGEGSPLVWETMVFSKEGEAVNYGDLDCKRCGGSIEQAREQHARMVTAVRAVAGLPTEEKFEDR